MNLPDTTLAPHPAVAALHTHADMLTALLLLLWVPLLTCGGMDEHSLARLHSSSRTEAGISGEEDGRQCASRSRRNVRRDRHHCREEGKQ